MLPALSRRTPSAPARLSVVVPVFNVKRYLADCLESLAAQTYTDFDVVLVDDGSTDGSTALARRFIRHRAGWQLTASGGRGPGGARNHGVRLARGELLAFLDSDDLLPPDAYELMITTLDTTGSDFVVGSLVRLVGGERVEPPWIRRAHARRRLATTVDEHPEILINVFPWSKVFRRSFYERAGLAFPERVRYEDQVFSTEAYLRADRFDVVRRPVYVWRIRDDGTSITQRRSELADLEDRVRTKQMTTDIVRRLGSAAVLDHWARGGLPGDLPVYFREIPGCADAYWQLLHTATRDLFLGLPPIEESRLPVAQRLVGWLVARGRRRDAETVLRWLDEHPEPLRLTVEGDHVRAALPLAADDACGIPPSVFWLGEHELRFEARLMNVTVEESLVVSGWAVVRGAPTDGVDVAIAARLEPAGGPALPFDVHQELAPEATTWVGRPGQSYDRSGFTARIDLDALRTHLGPDGCGAVLIEVSVAGIRRSGRFRSKAPALDVSGNTRGARVAATFSAGKGLVVTLAKP